MFIALFIDPVTLDTISVSVSLFVCIVRMIRPMPLNFRMALIILRQVLSINCSYNIDISNIGNNSNRPEHILYTVLGCR